MSDWNDVDFVVTRRKKDEDGNLLALEGRVIDDGQPRSQPLELGVAQVIDYIAQDGSFCTGRESLGTIERGGDLMVVDEGEQLRLRTVDDTDEKFHLGSLPTYEEAD